MVELACRISCFCLSHGYVSKVAHSINQSIHVGKLRKLSPHAVGSKLLIVA